MKTLRTVLATFGITTHLYGGFALITVGVDPAFAGKSIYQMFRDTGFPSLVIGIACLLSVLIILFTGAAFRDNTKSRKVSSEDEDFFLENETVPVEEYEEQWISKKAPSEKDSSASKEEPAETPDLFADDDSYKESDEDSSPSLDDSFFAPSRSPESMRYCIFCGTPYPTTAAVCPKCGKRS